MGVGRSTAIGALFALFVTTVAGATTTAFRFRVPSGWVDLSPGVPAENLARVLPTVRERAEDNRIGERLFMAAPPDVEAVAMAYLASEADSNPLDGRGFDAARAHLGWQGHFVVEEGRREVVRGLVWARFTGRIADRPGKRFVCYVVPGNPRSVTVLLAAPADSIESLLPAFDDAARATEGAENPPEKARGVEAFMLLGLGLVILGWMRLRRRKRADPPTARPD